MEESELKFENEETVYRDHVGQPELDGILVSLGQVRITRADDTFSHTPLIFTANLLLPEFEDPEKRKELIRKGVEMLSGKPGPEDVGDYRLRVIEHGRIWVITNFKKDKIFEVSNKHFNAESVSHHSS